MGGDQETGGLIELSYRPTADDFREALSARAKASASARRTRLLLVFVAVCAVVGGALSLAAGKSVDPPIIVMAVVAVLLLAGLPRLQARQFHRLAAPKGDFHAVVGGPGIRVTTQHASSTLTWQAAPRYAETPGLFVLLSNDRNASCLTVLPKRGLAQATDVDRLRAVLEQHLTRVG